VNNIVKHNIFESKGYVLNAVEKWAMGGEKGKGL
jgi:hypothetical protein